MSPSNTDSTAHEDRLAALLEYLAQTSPQALDERERAALAKRFDLPIADVRDCIRACRDLELALAAPDVDTTEAPPAPILPSGYTLVRELGRGGMGVVYQVRHDALQRDVALKIILPGRSRFEEALARFRREARSLAKLRHRHIVAIHDFGVFEGAMWFTMEWIDGSTLDHELSAGPLPSRRAVRIVQQVAEAVDYAHGQGVIHRDLKPSNILLEPQSEDSDGEHAKVVDFGLARLDEDSRGEVSTLDLATRTGQLLGTPAYMSPEQVRGEVADESADIWALGAILFECLTGHRPFEQTELHAVIAAIHSEPVRAPSSVPLDGGEQGRAGRDSRRVPAALDAICLQAMHRNPGRRYPTARALADDLGRFARGEPVRAKPPAAAERAWLWLTRYAGHLLMALIGGLVALALVFVVTGLGQRKSAEDHRQAGTEARRRAEYALAAAAFDQAASRSEGDDHWSNRALSLASQVDRISELTRLGRDAMRSEQIAATRDWLASSDDQPGFSVDPRHPGMALWIERARFEVLAELDSRPACERLLSKVPHTELVEALARRIDSPSAKRGELLPTVKLLLATLRQPTDGAAWDRLLPLSQAACKVAMERVDPWLAATERAVAQDLEKASMEGGARRMALTHRLRIAVLIQNEADDPLPLLETSHRVHAGGSAQDFRRTAPLPRECLVSGITLRWPQEDPMDANGGIPGAGTVQLRGVALLEADHKVRVLAEIHTQPGVKAFRHGTAIRQSIPVGGAVVAGSLELDGQPQDERTTTLYVTVGIEGESASSPERPPQPWTLAQWRQAIRTSLAAGEPLTPDPQWPGRGPYAQFDDVIDLGVRDVREPAQRLAAQIHGVPEFYGLALGLEGTLRKDGPPTTGWRAMRNDDVDLLRAALLAPDVAARERLARAVLQSPYRAGGRQALGAAVARGALKLDDQELLAAIRAEPLFAPSTSWLGWILSWLVTVLATVALFVALAAVYRRYWSRMPTWLRVIGMVGAYFAVSLGLTSVTGPARDPFPVILLGFTLACLLSRNPRSRLHSRSLVAPPVAPPWQVFAVGCVLLALEVHWHGYGIPLWARFPVLLLAVAIWWRRSPRNLHRWLPLLAIVSALGLAAVPADAFSAWWLTPRSMVTLLVLAAALSMAVSSREQSQIHFRAVRRRLGRKSGRSRVATA